MDNQKIDKTAKIRKKNETISKTHHKIKVIFLQNLKIIWQK